MTWFGEDIKHKDECVSASSKARQRWDNLRRDCRQVVEVGEYYVLVLWPMSGWQVWKKTDKTWVEYQCDCADMNEAIALATQMARG